MSGRVVEQIGRLASGRLTDGQICEQVGRNQTSVRQIVEWPHQPSHGGLVGDRTGVQMDGKSCR